MNKWTSLLLVLCLVASLSAAEPAVQFARKPTVAKTADGWQIGFALNRATDVAIAIEDANGKAVRHLVAGVLGKKPPAPLKADSLEQSVTWDGKDDYGQPVPGTGPFRVRVSAGMNPQFDRFMLDNPAAMGSVSALAVGAGGEVFCFHLDATGNGNMGGNKIKVLKRDGTTARTIWPMPANLPPERLKAAGVFTTPDGKLVPRLHNYEQLSFYPDPIHARNRSMPGYSSPAVDAQGRLYWLATGARLACVDKDGGIPYPTLFSEPVLKLKGARLCDGYGHGLERVFQTVSSDGKWLYFAGLTSGLGDYKFRKPIPAVFRVSLETRADAEVFLGGVEQAGDDDKSFAWPRGLATAGGLLYVADYGNDRIQIFKEADKSLAGTVKVAKPDSIGLDPGTGAIYVCSPIGKDKQGGYVESRTAAELIKLENAKTGKELYRLTLPPSGGAPWDNEHRIAVDASAKPVVIWLPGLSYVAQGVFRVEDAGDKFTPAVDPRDTKTPWAEGPRDMNVDRARDELYVKVNPEKWLRFDEKTGERTGAFEPRIGSSANGTQMVPFRDGKLYTWSWALGLILFDRDGKKVNWPGQSSPVIPLGGIMCFQERHLEVLSPDELMIVLNPQWSAPGAEQPKAWTTLFGDKPNPQARTLNTSIGVIGPDGKLKRTVIWQCMQGATPRVDPKGNIYLAEIIKPADRSYPEFFDGKLEPAEKFNNKTQFGPEYWTSYVCGSIIKFPPTGGAVWFGKNPSPNVLGEPPAELLAKPRVKVRAHIGYNPVVPAELQGAEWFHLGYAPFSCMSTTSADTCMCEGSRFDVDPYGRVFLGNLCQFRVEVLDTNGNVLKTFGEYGNEDAGRAGFAAAGPPGVIPIAWPNSVAASDTHIYIGDTLNRRVVKVKMNYEAVETAELK